MEMFLESNCIAYGLWKSWARLRRSQAEDVSSSWFRVETNSSNNGDGRIDNLTENTVDVQQLQDLETNKKE